MDLGQQWYGITCGPVTDTVLARNEIGMQDQHLPKFCLLLVCSGIAGCNICTTRLSIHDCHIKCIACSSTAWELSLDSIAVSKTT